MLCYSSSGVPCGHLSTPNHTRETTTKNNSIKNPNHCEKRSDTAISQSKQYLKKIAASSLLAMTVLNLIQKKTLNPEGFTI